MSHRWRWQHNLYRSLIPFQFISVSFGYAQPILAFHKFFFGSIWQIAFYNAINWWANATITTTTTACRQLYISASVAFNGDTPHVWWLTLSCTIHSFKTNKCIQGRRETHTHKQRIRVCAAHYGHLVACHLRHVATCSEWLWIWKQERGGETSIVAVVVVASNRI